MKVALGQFAVDPDWKRNADQGQTLMIRAQDGGADLLVLPEGVLARDITDRHSVLKSAQPLDGPFITQLLQASCGLRLSTMFTLHVPAEAGRVWNTLITLCNGQILSQYRKLHLYDAFASKESEHVFTGKVIAPLVTVAGWRVGLMTCYDLRFPELARRLVWDGAELLVAPAAWMRGPLKEMHWDVLVRARALENTCYVAAVGECGERNIGNSMLVDPLGVAILRAAEAPALLFADIDPARLAQVRKLLPVLQNRRFVRPELQA